MVSVDYNLKQDLKFEKIESIRVFKQNRQKHYRGNHSYSSVTVI